MCDFGCDKKINENLDNFLLVVLILSTVMIICVCKCCFTSELTFLKVYTLLKSIFNVNVLLIILDSFVFLKQIFNSSQMHALLVII